MGRVGCKLQPGHLNTREERRQSRFISQDLEAQLHRTTDPEQRLGLERQLENVRREQAHDRQVSPRSKKGRKGRK